MIPKKIHLTWPDKNIINHKGNGATLFDLGVRRLVNLNPDWEVTIHDNNDVDDYLKDILGDEFNTLFKDTHIVARTDLWRLYKIFFEGGMYVDMDRLCNINLSAHIPDHIRWVLPTWADHDFSHDLMCSDTFNPVYRKTIDLYLQRRRSGERNVYALGAQTYMHAITDTLFGRIINTNPGVEEFSAIRRSLEAIPFILTYRESSPTHTFLYRNMDPKNEFLNHELLKRQLYIDSNLKHWTGEW